MKILTFCLALLMICGSLMAQTNNNTFPVRYYWNATNPADPLNGKIIAPTNIVTANNFGVVTSGTNTIITYQTNITTVSQTTGDGSGLTNLQSTNLVGTLPLTNLPSVVITNGQPGVAVITVSNASTAGTAAHLSSNDNVTNLTVHALNLSTNGADGPFSIFEDVDDSLHLYSPYGADVYLGGGGSFHSYGYQDVYGHIPASTNILTKNGNGSGLTNVPANAVVGLGNAALANTNTMSIGGSSATATTATNAYQLVTPTLLDRFNAQPAIGLEQIYALDNFNRASNSLFGAGIVINSPIGNQVTFANNGWAGYFSITNGYLEISNTAAGGLPMFLAQKTIRVGDFVSAKVLSIDHGAVGVGLADVGFYNTNKPGGYANIAVARFGDEQSSTHYSLGMRWTDFTNTTYIYSSQDVLSDFGDASTILALGVSYDTTNTCTFWVQGSWMSSQFNCPLGSESKWYPYASLTNSQLPGCLPGLSSSGGQVNCVEQFDDFTVRHNWRPDPQNQLLLFHGGTTYPGLQYYGDHVPDVLKLPNGGFVYTGESGTNNSSSDLVLWAQYCSPQGRWYPATNLLASSIVGVATNTYNAAASALVNGNIWFIYDQSTNSFQTGGGVYYNILTVTNGIFTLGVQNPFPFCGTNDGVHQYLNNNGIFQVPAGYPFAGRYLFEWGSYNGSGMATASQVAWSDDGTNWNTTASISGFGNPGETSIVSQRDGTLIALQNQGQTAGTNLLTSVSVNGGTNWTAWLPATNLANANLNLVSAYNRPMTHLLPNGLYAIATSQGPNARTNGIIYICDTGAKVVRTIPFGWYGPTASLSGLVQYPDFAVDGDCLDLVWSGGCNGIHFYKVPLKYADTIWSSSGTSYANYCYGLTNLNINSTSQTNVTLNNPTFTGTSTGATMQVTTVNATIVNGNGYGLTNLQASGVSTNGGTTGQAMINGGNGTVLWTNNQSIVAAGDGETTETMSTNPVTGQVTYTSNVNTNQFLGAGAGGYRDGVNVTNINASANGLVPNTPAGIKAAGGDTNAPSAYDLSGVGVSAAQAVTNNFLARLSTGDSGGQTNIPAIQIVGVLNTSFPTNHIGPLLQINILWGTTNIFLLGCYTNQ